MPRTTRERQGQRTLLDLCLGLHMSNTGSSDIIPTYQEDLEIITQAVKDWELPQHPKWIPFDSGVYNLLLMTLAECEMHGP